MSLSSGVSETVELLLFTWMWFALMTNSTSIFLPTTNGFDRLLITPLQKK
jgi:hypothetical protein